jgi:hypothetical protein
MASKEFNGNPHSVPLQVTSSPLGADFQPSDFSVICGRGKDSYDHIGNYHFRELATMFVARYSRASSKTDKSEIVSEIVNMIQQAGPGGAFCKYENGAWFKVSDIYAREKVSALLRDMVLAQQGSPAKAEKAKVKSARPKIQKRSKIQTQQRSPVKAKKQLKLNDCGDDMGDSEAEAGIRESACSPALSRHAESSTAVLDTSVSNAIHHQYMALQATEAKGQPIATDPQVGYVRALTLSYTFFQTDVDDDDDDDDDEESEVEEKAAA